MQLRAAQPGQTNDKNVVVLAEKDRLDPLEATLAPSEMIFLRHGAAQDITSFVFPRHASSVFVRLLKPDKNHAFAEEDARLAGNELLGELRKYKVTEVSVRNFCADDHALAFAEGMALGNYQFLKYFSDADKKAHLLREIVVEGASEQSVAELNILLEAVFLARDMVNEPHSNLNAVQLAETVTHIGKECGFEVEVLGKEKIETLKMGGLLAVNRASSVPPQFCILEWKPTNAHNEKPVVLVGKGVVYDTGGLSLKPTEGMDYMKCDMAGAASVVGALAAASRNQLPVHLIGLIPATDNQIGERAIAPGDVVRMYSGQTVEVLNTDAEGRIILADALHYAKKYAPELVLDFATLTGSAVRALGVQAICYMGTAPKDVKEALEASGWATYERLVEFPLWREFGEDIKSHIADFKNIGSSNAGMITAGKFLEQFATDYPWLHLDIAGPAYLRTANGYRTKEGTGVGVRLIYDFLKKKYAGRV
ncbi:MAG: leucyl aminopeptidase [Saprospiraceae bacterium]|nr:leucyl aminopeptidase [Saprospiraceae bacterium]